MNSIEKTNANMQSSLNRQISDLDKLTSDAQRSMDEMRRLLDAEGLTGTHSVHASARSLRHDTSVCGNPEIFFGGKLNGVGIPENEYKVTDSALVQNVVAAIEAR